MTCEQINELLGDAVDGTLSASDSAIVRSHTDSCSACRQLLADLIDIRHTASLLERHEPSLDLRRAIKSEVQKIAPQPARRPGLGLWSGLAMAASLAVVLGSAVWLYFAAQPRTNPDAAAQLASATSELQLAEQHYDNAIAALEKLTADRNAKLDPQVAGAIAQSLATIDRAIGDSRAALKTQPDSIVAQTSLLEALRMKVALLQETVSLMNAS